MVEDVQKVCKKVTSEAVEIDEMLIQVEVTCDRKGKWFVKMIGFSVMLCQAIIGRDFDTNLSWSNFSSHDGIIRSTLVSKPWIKSNFPNILKTPSIKFKAIISQFHIRIDIIWSKVACLWYSYFNCWHFWHFVTNSAISFFMLDHQWICFKSWYILIKSGWIKYHES